MLDPIQRFIDAAGEDRLTALNELVHEAREIAHGRHWIVMATSDTTKAGAGSDKDMTGDPAALAASAATVAAGFAAGGIARAGGGALVGAAGVARGGLSWLAARAVTRRGTRRGRGV